MDNTFLIDNILSEWALRSPSGLCSESLSEEDLECLLETVQDLAFDVIKDPSNFVNEISVISEKGKHPERQAYNKNGLLVTFPTPEYKARAIAKGTHFEKNPKSSQTNLFGGGQQAPQGAAPSINPISKDNMDAGQSELPQSDSGQPQTEPAKKKEPQPGMPGGDVPKAPSGGGMSSGGSSEPPAQGQLAVEPPTQSAVPTVSTVQPTPTPPPVQKTPEEIAAEKQVIKQMMNTDDTLPTVPGVGGSGMAENLKEQLGQLTKIAVEMKLNEAVKFLSNHL
jgi:hypothetical protein